MCSLSTSLAPGAILHISTAYLSYYGIYLNCHLNYLLYIARAVSTTKAKNCVVLLIIILLSAWLSV